MLRVQWHTAKSKVDSDVAAIGRRQLRLCTVPVTTRLRSQGKVLPTTTRGDGDRDRAMARQQTRSQPRIPNLIRARVVRASFHLIANVGCLSPYSNWVLNASILFETALTALLIYDPFLNHVLQTVPVHWRSWICTLPTIGVMLGLEETRKLLIRCFPRSLLGRALLA